MNTTDYVENKLQPPRAFFEWCYTSFRTYVWKNKEDLIFARNKRKKLLKQKIPVPSSVELLIEEKKYEEITPPPKKSTLKRYYNE